MSDWTAEHADWYAEKYGEYPTNHLAIDAIDLPPDATIVDIGCGTGSALRHAALKAPNNTFVGVDPVPRMLEIAHERLKGHPGEARISFVEGHAHDIPVEDGQAALALAFDTFDHWGDHKREGLREVRRILKPGGRFIAVKDEGAPTGAKEKAAFVEALWEEGFEIEREEAIAKDDVSFTLWVCAPKG